MLHGNTTRIRDVPASEPWPDLCKTTDETMRLFQGMGILRDARGTTVACPRLGGCSLRVLPQILSKLMQVVKSLRSDRSAVAKAGVLEYQSGNEPMGCGLETRGSDPAALCVCSLRRLLDDRRRRAASPEVAGARLSI